MGAIVLRRVFGVWFGIVVLGGAGIGAPPALAAKAAATRRFVGTVDARGAVFFGGLGGGPCKISYLPHAQRPVALQIGSERRVTVRSSGQESMGVNPAHDRLHGADGGSGLATTVKPMNGLSAVKAMRIGALVGAFVGPGPTPGPYTGGTNFWVLAPPKNQVFFIGNGSTTTGRVQEFVVPSGATKLVLGFVDGPWPKPADPQYGCAHYYKDNVGSLKLVVTLKP